MSDVNKQDLELHIKLDADWLEKLPRDVSPRQYLRGEREGQKFILMLYPDASLENRAEIKSFVSIGNDLSANGIKTPQIYEFNEEKCYAILEDLGSISFGDCLRAGTVENKQLYTLATDVLIHMRDVKSSKELPDYKNSRIYENRRQLIDYYMPLKCNDASNEDMVGEFLSIWQEIEDSLPICPHGFTHGDYHLENLMYQEKEHGLNQCAVIDFQDALTAPLPYDLVNLIEDARIDVPKDIHDAMIERYCDGMSKEEKDIFLIWFRVLAAQFHGRVIGLFIKLAAEQGRDSYLIHIPRLQRYMQRSLNYPMLKPLKEWFDKVGLDFEPIKDLDGEYIRKVFANKVH